MGFTHHVPQSLVQTTCDNQCNPKEIYYINNPVALFWGWQIIQWKRSISSRKHPRLIAHKCLINQDHFMQLSRDEARTMPPKRLKGGKWAIKNDLDSKPRTTAMFSFGWYRAGSLSANNLDDLDGLVGMIQ